MKSIYNPLSIFLFSSLLFWGFSESCDQPKRYAYLSDAGYFLEKNEFQIIQKKLEFLAKNRSYKLYVYTVISERIANHSDFGRDVFNMISYGRQEGNPNILLFLAYNERHSYIYVGDENARLLTNELIKVCLDSLGMQFSKHNYSQGINQSILFIDSVVSENHHTRYKQ